MSGTVGVGYRRIFCARASGAGSEVAAATTRRLRGKAMWPRRGKITPLHQAVLVRAPITARGLEVAGIASLRVETSATVEEAARGM